MKFPAKMQKKIEKWLKNKRQKDKASKAFKQFCEKYLQITISLFVLGSIIMKKLEKDSYKNRPYRKEKL